MQRPFADKPWQHICKVDVAPLVEWFGQVDQTWSEVVSPTKPQRTFVLPEGITRSIVEEVLAHFPCPVVAHQLMLSRMLPHRSHPLHVDSQRADWITRVHVPLVTNNKAWMLFEEEAGHVHFKVGWAYSFDTTRRHAFGNDGDEPRIHFIFDVLRQD